MKNEIQQPGKVSIARFLSNQSIKENVEDVVGKNNIQSFVSSIVSAVQTTPDLAKCTNQSILSVGLLMQSLNLPPSPQLGYAHFVPYKMKDGTYKATFQLSEKGMIQLAMRTGQYKKINVCDVREGEIKKYNPIFDQFEADPIQDPVEREKAKIIGYYGFFETVNGFSKGLYMTVDQIRKHAETYSALYRSDLQYNSNKSQWSTNFGVMAEKTILKRLLSKYGIMSVELQKAVVSDQAAINEDSVEYVDNEPEPHQPEVIDVYAEEKEGQKDEN